MEYKISANLNAALVYARDEAMRTGSLSVDGDHLLLGLLRQRDNEACRILSSFGIDLDDLKGFIDAHVFHETAIPFSDCDKVAVSAEAWNILNMASGEAQREDLDEVSTFHLLVAIVRFPDNVGGDYLAHRGVSPSSLLADRYVKSGKSVRPGGLQVADIANAMLLMTDMQHKNTLN